MVQLFHITQDGIVKLEAELAQLVARRGPMAERIKAAREFGDLAENAEYTSARQEQEHVESRIAKIEGILLNARIISVPEQKGQVQLGSTVSLVSGSLSRRFQIVGTVEADPLNGRISDESPIGQALLGKKVGDMVDVSPTHQLFVITEIS